MSKHKQTEFNRESFVFYNSFFEAIDNCPLEAQRDIYRAITAYALKGEQPLLTGVGAAVFLMAKPQLDANTRRYLNGRHPAKDGKKRGAPKGNQNARKQKKPGTDKATSTGKPEKPEAPEEAETPPAKFPTAAEVYEFGEAHNIGRGICKKFVEYNADRGETLQNWQGALIAFANSGYTQQKYEEANGIEPDGAKKEFAPYVRLTPEEHAALLAEFGSETTATALQLLSDYKATHGKRYKSDCAAIRGWVIPKLNGEPPKRTKRSTSEAPTDEQTQGRTRYKSTL